MANRVVLGKRPAHFKEIEVHVTLPDGTEGIIPVTFHYKTKTEFGAWQDEAIRNGAERIDASVGEFSWERAYAESSARVADALFDVIHDWGLDVPLSRDVLLELEADCGAGAIPAMMEAFAAACRTGRLGNLPK